MINRKFISDYERFTPNKYKFFPCVARMIKNHELRYLFWGRVASDPKMWGVKKIAQIILHKYRRKYGIEINFNKVGEGLRFQHPWNITVNSNAIIGNNVTLYKGCTIGEIIYGKRKGTPRICNDVVIYQNATVCGNVTIGANSIIAAGAFVNFDVPENSIVIGNPGVIHIVRVAPTVNKL